jgi:site-specific recombinase XerD
MLLISTYGSKLNENVVIANFRKYDNKAGVKVRYTPHVWRQTF